MMAYNFSAKDFCQADKVRELWEMSFKNDQMFCSSTKDSERLRIRECCPGCRDNVSCSVAMGLGVYGSKDVGCGDVQRAVA
jgi:hypothetical protein